MFYANRHVHSLYRWDRLLHSQGTQSDPGRHYHLSAKAQRLYELFTLQQECVEWVGAAAPDRAAQAEKPPKSPPSSVTGNPGAQGPAGELWEKSSGMRR